MTAVIDAALAELDRVDHDAARAARAAYGSLVGDAGPERVTGHGLADFLWNQLAVSWPVGLDEKLFLAASLGELFTRLDMPRYAAMCDGDTTARILTTYAREGPAAGLKAYRSALDATGFQPPDLPGVIVWGSVMGPDETGAYLSASAVLEMAITAGEVRPGADGWRDSAARVTAGFLDGPRDGTTGSTWLQWVHTERLQGFTDSRAPARARLATRAGDRLIAPAPVPADAADVLAPVRWLLTHAAAGADLTAVGGLALPIVAEGCRRFGWHGDPRSEADVAELRTLRDWAEQMGVVRRAGRQLALSSTGRTVHAGDVAGLWQATMDALITPGAAEAAAGEIALMLLMEDPPPQDGNADRNALVAEALAGEGWRGQLDRPVTGEQVAALLAILDDRLRLLGLAVGARPTPAGRAAAHTALRTRALRPRP